MVSSADLITATKRLLLSGQNETKNKLAADVAPGTGSLTLSFDVSGIGAGSIVQVGFELFHVWAVTPGTSTLTVEPAQGGTDAAAHDHGDLVIVNPKFASQNILDALNDDLADLSSPVNGLFAVRTSDLTFASGRSGYDLTGVSDLLEVMDVRYNTGATPGDFQSLTNFTLARGLPANYYASGNALMITDTNGNGRSMVVTYKASFAPITATTADVAATSGLPLTAMDLPPMGAAIRLVSGREIRRNFTDAQGDARKAGEVPAGAIAASWRGLEAKRQQRITAEAARLAQTYPDRGFTPPAFGSPW